MGLVEHGTVRENLPGVSFQLNETYTPFCTQIGLIAREGTCRSVNVLRDSGSLMTLLCSSMVGWFEYVDTREVRLIQGIFGSPAKVPLVKVDLDGKRETLLCGLIGRLLPGVTLLLANDYSKLLPLSVSVVTRSKARMNECTNVHNDESVRLHFSESQCNAVNDLVVSGDARQSVTSLQAQCVYACVG